MTPILIESAVNRTSATATATATYSAASEAPNTNLTLPFGEYLFKRLQQINNLKSIFGVPGDFNLGLLEHLYKTDLNWIGGCNELNSGYSADGYSRYTNSLGVLITTYGVGELSAINAVSGAFAESSKVLHIVGIPFYKQLNDEVENKKNLHHLVPNIDTFKPSNHLVYAEMVSNISCISKVVLDPSQAVDNLDQVIQEIFKKSKPGYLFLPADLCDLEVEASRLYNNPATTFHQVHEDLNPDLTYDIANLVLEKIYSSKQTSILADTLVDRFDQCTSMLRKFVELTNFNNYTTFMGKSVLDESNPNFVGDYIGIESNIGIKENLEDSDLVLYFGPYINEINSGHHSFDFTQEQLILFHPDYIKVGTQIYHQVNFVHVLQTMLKNLNQSRLPKNNSLRYEIKQRYPGLPSKASLSQSTLLAKFGEFVRPNDVIVCETGSFMFGVPDLRFPTNVKYIAQGFYLSIGAALPYSVGVGIAMRDEGSSSRLILIEGDGSAQMTYQEISAFPYFGLNPIIFLLNNSGYTVERIIKGETRPYNDIKPWNWAKTFELFEFGDKTTRTKAIKVSNEVELDRTLVEVSNGEDEEKLRFMEVVLDKMDCPWRFHHMNGYRHLPVPI